MGFEKFGGLGSDQKIENIFHAYGYSIPVGKDGRRLWPKRFKDEIGARMSAGELSLRGVAKTCGIPRATASEWRREARKSADEHPALKELPAFAELKVVEEAPAPPQPIALRRGGCEVVFPAGFPVARIAALIKALEGRA